MPLVKPAGYRNLLDNVENTEKAIKLVKDMFQQNLSAQLALLRVTAPMVVLSGTGINDDLNSVERPVSFPIRDMGERRAEVVHSLAKWKRLKLAEMAVAPGRGIYTDMNALRPDEELDNIHSLYVDQWDWEKVITREQRTVSFLKQTVRRIYEAIKVTENRLYVEFPQIVPMLPEEIRFIHAQRLLDLYPDKTPKERENEIVRRYGAVFVMGIGAPLSDGRPHDGRAADYDDWSTPGEDGYPGLNGDVRSPASWICAGGATKSASIFTGSCLPASCPARSEAVSGSRGCACSCFARPISARFRAVSGPSRCAASARKPASSWSDAGPRSRRPFSVRRAGACGCGYGGRALFRLAAFCSRQYPTHAKRSRENCRKIPESGFGYFQEPDRL